MIEVNPLSKHLAKTGFKPADSTGKLWFPPDAMLLQAARKVEASRQKHKLAQGLTIKEYAEALKEVKK